VFESLLAVMLSDRVADKSHVMPPRDPRQAASAAQQRSVASARRGRLTHSGAFQISQ
jgi:hypothetical protein